MKKKSPSGNSIPLTTREIRAAKRASKGKAPPVQTDESIDLELLIEKFGAEFPPSATLAFAEIHLSRVEEGAAALICRRGFGHLLTTDKSDPENVRYQLSDEGLNPQLTWDKDICLAIRLIPLVQTARQFLNDAAPPHVILSLGMEIGRLFNLMWRSTPEQEEIRDAGLRALSKARRTGATLREGTIKQQVMDRLRNLPPFNDGRIETLRTEFKNVEFDTLERYIREHDRATRDAGG
jgi:hypothetical protein